MKKDLTLHPYLIQYSQVSETVTLSEIDMSHIANEIYRQLGGNRFRVMTGAKMMVSTENGIRMRIGRNKTNANFMEVSLNGLDLYDVTFAKLTKMGEMKSVKTYDNVYNDMLVSIFESHTGMYTTL